MDCWFGSSTSNPKQLVGSLPRRSKTGVELEWDNKSPESRDCQAGFLCCYRRQGNTLLL